MAHFEVLQGILGTAKKRARLCVYLDESHRPEWIHFDQKLSFPFVPKSDLKNLRIDRKFLNIQTDKLEALLKVGNARDSHIEQLCSRISRIYRHVSMRVSTSLQYFGGRVYETGISIEV